MKQCLCSENLSEAGERGEGFQEIKFEVSVSVASTLLRNTLDLTMSEEHGPIQTFSSGLLCYLPPLNHLCDFVLTQALLDAKREAFIKKNMDVSSARCSDLLEDIFGPLEKEVKQGTFSKPGGYYLFLQKKQELEKKYNQIPGKGLQVK